MRRCEQCGTTMAPFEPRIRLTSGLLGCSGCQTLSFKKVSVLPNPAGQGKAKDEWYHGSPHAFEELDTDPGRYQDYDEEYEQGRFKHWNTLIGPHFGSQHFVARDFAEGGHGFFGHGEEADLDPYHHQGPMQHVVHVKLHIKNPKVYDSEYDMDHEVHAHELAQGNTFQKHFPKPDEDDDPEYHDEYEDTERTLGKEYLEADKPFGPREMDERGRPKSTKWLSRHPDKAGIAQRYKERMEREGHDGVVYGNEYEGGGKAAIAFHPHQVEETQHHYGPVCLTDKQIQERKQIPGQGHLEGMEDMSHRRYPVDPKFIDPYLDWTKTNHPGWEPGPHKSPVSGQRPLFPPLASNHVPFHTAAMGDPTDWDTYYDPSAQVHRGMFAKVPFKLWEKLHDPEQVEQAGQELAAHTSKRKSVGMHWSADLEQARDFGSPKTVQSLQLPVVLHGQMPAREAIETRPSVLKRNEVFPHDHREREVPLRKGSGVDVFGISWKPEGEHPAADKDGWVRHDFTAPIQHTAKSWTMKYTTYGPSGYVDKEREVEGPLYHGSRAKNLRPGDLIRPGRKTNPWGDEGAKSKHVFFTTRHDTARSYADDAGGHVYEVEPTGEFHTDYNGDDYKTKHPLMVIRKVEPEQKTSAQQPYGEQSALNEMGKQDVYAVRSGDTMINLCEYHRDVHVGNSRAADSLGAGLGIGARERSAEALGEARKGRCAACGKDTAYQLKLLTPRSMQSRHKEDRQPRRRGESYVPTRTKPLTPLRQSENVREQSTFYHGTAYDENVRYHPESGEHSIHPDIETGAVVLHPSRQAAWKHAIGEFEYEDSDFPRVHSVHIKDIPENAERTPEGGFKTSSVIHDARPEEHQHWQDPEIKLPHERGPILYHGTTHAHENDDPGDSIKGESLKSIDPGVSSPTHGGGVSDSSYAYATPSLENAWHYAEFRSEYGPGGVPHVYRVTPHKPEDLEEDPMFVNGQNRGNKSGDMRSKSGFKVLDDVPMPHQMKHEQTQAFEESQHDYEEDDDWGESHHGIKESTGMTASKRLPTLRMLAHDATENQAIMHCPFCGGGKVIGRADGTVECEFCGSYFTVQVQPQYPNFPQTINGQPQQIPGMPGDVETPGGSLGGDELPPGDLGDEDGGEDGNPFAQGDGGDLGDAEDGDEDEEPPPFAKKSFRTATGALLGEDDYVRHLAIRAAPDRDAMIAHIRSERGAR